MTLRAKVLAYVVAVHVALGAAAWFVIAAWFNVFELRFLLFAIEALFVLSIAISARLVRALFLPIDILRTGAELLAERDFTSHFAPVGQPEFDTLVDVYNRMAERLREERLAAEEQHQLLEKIVEASPAGIVICDFDGNIARANPAAERLLTPELRTELATVAPGESRMVVNRGARRVRVHRAEFRDRGFAKSFFVIEELTEELRLSEKAAYEKLIRMMSHEVNNSVGAVRSLLESLLSYAPQVGTDDRDDFTNALTVASARMDALNRFMAAFAEVVRIPPPTKAPTNVAELVERVAALLRPELTQRSITLQLALDDRGAFDVDASQLEQVVLNIFRNAIDAVARDGTLFVTLRDGVLAIGDSGPGIADSVRAELFTPFFTTKRDGRGLGLTIVQEILANHALAFSLENRPGGGAEFRIAL
jgi:two-component system, NtrC family, nitrogen regulation sensor histidine kinase NtrY